MKFFDDLLISYRGAGVIGTCMAVFTLVSVICLSLFAFDPDLSKIGGGESGASVSARQEKEIGRLNREVDDAERRYQESGRFRADIERNISRQSAADTKLKEITAKLEKTQADLAAMQEGREVYARAYRQQVREKAVGEVLPSMDLSDGRHLESPVVKEVNPAGIQVSYSGGIIRVPASKLPEAIRERFQFDSEEMESFLEAEKQHNAKFAQEMDSGLAEAKEKNRKAKIARLEKKNEILKERVKACAQQYAILRPNQYRNYNTLVALIRQVEADEKAIQQVQSELEMLKTETGAGASK